MDLCYCITVILLWISKAPSFLKTPLTWTKSLSPSKTFFTAFPMRSTVQQQENIRILITTPGFLLEGGTRVPAYFQIGHKEELVTSSSVVCPPTHVGVPSHFKTWWNSCMRLLKYEYRLLGCIHDIVLHRMSVLTSLNSAYTASYWFKSSTLRIFQNRSLLVVFYTPIHYHICSRAYSARKEKFDISKTTFRWFPRGLI